MKPEGGPGTLAIMVAKGKPKPPKGELGDGAEDREMDEEADSHETAADEIFDAVKSDDREGFRSALKAYIETCVAEYERG